MTFIATAAASAAIAFCAIVPGCAPSAPARPAVVEIAWNNHEVVDVDPPQRLDVVFDATYREDWPSDGALASAVADCENMGGELIENPNPDKFVCEGVDY